jgi:hypothetical protein
MTPRIFAIVMQELAGNGFSQAEAILFSEFFHAAYGGVTRSAGVIFGVRKQCDGCIDELVNRADNAALNGVLDRLLLLGREFNGHMLLSIEAKGPFVAVKPLFPAHNPAHNLRCLIRLTGILAVPAYL